MDELVEKAKNGDKEAFIRCINAINKKMYYIAKSKLKYEEDIKEVIQETILECYKSIKKLKDISKFEKWVIKLLINNCNDYYRRKKNVSFTEYSEEVLETNNAEGEIFNVNSKIDFSYLINMLNSEDRLIFTLYYSSGYSTAEIAKIININENTIKSRLKRCRERIGKFIERWEETSEGK
ncbi:MAG: sigma-70 family RNA polymerase sigma factor [Clostridia bacterium]|nr:sigma-70 family RNA polymerase sigma factor [Clostridia bacterium]